MFAENLATCLIVLPNQGYVIEHSALRHFQCFSFSFDFISAVPLGKLIILDLASDIYPIYQRTHGYFGYPYIWNMIENFGGNTRLYGKNEDNVKSEEIIFIQFVLPEAARYLVDSIAIRLDTWEKWNLCRQDVPVLQFFRKSSLQFGILWKQNSSGFLIFRGGIEIANLFEMG